MLQMFSPMYDLQVLAAPFFLMNLMLSMSLRAFFRVETKLCLIHCRSPFIFLTAEVLSVYMYAYLKLCSWKGLLFVLEASGMCI